MDDKFKKLRSELRSIRSELHNVKSKLQKLKNSLPAFPSPEILYHKIVETVRDVMFCIGILDNIHKDVCLVDNPSEEDGADWEARVQILEAKTENCEMQFCLLRLTLRTLYAIPPVLIATNEISESAWEAMMTQPQSYYREDKKYPLPIELDVVENIIQDQLKSAKDVLGSLRAMRSKLLEDERLSRKHLEETVLETMKSIESKLQELKEASEKANQNPSSEEGEADAPWHQEQEAIRANADYMEGLIVDDEESLEELTRKQQELDDQIFCLRNRIELLEREQPCFPRSFLGLILRSEEKNMRCVFCNVPGEHYSDSCPSLGDGESRRAAAKQSNRCFLCLEWWCSRGASCPKNKSRCFHCGKSDHHSALCCLPDVASKIQKEIDPLKHELFKKQRQRDELRKKIDLFNIEP
ncbi:hypothetical protein OSTOST_02240 [Ostertagia ostertagi]